MTNNLYNIIQILAILVYIKMYSIIFIVYFNLFIYKKFCIIKKRNLKKKKTLIFI